MIPDLIPLGVIYYKLIFLNCRNQRSVLFRRTLLFMYLCVILYFTMMPVIAAIPQRFADSGFNYNFVLFVDWQMGRVCAVRIPSVSVHRSFILESGVRGLSDKFPD